MYCLMALVVSDKGFARFIGVPWIPRTCGDVQCAQITHEDQTISKFHSLMASSYSCNRIGIATELVS